MKLMRLLVGEDNDKNSGIRCLARKHEPGCGGRGKDARPGVFFPGRNVSFAIFKKSLD